MPITKNHRGLVTVIAKLLGRTGFRGKRFRTADLGLVINLISQAAYNGRISISVDEQLINNSFKFDENGGKRSVLQLAVFLDSSYDESDKTVLIVEKKREKREDGSNGRTNTTIGVFSTVRNAEQASEISPILKWDAHHSIVGSLVGWLEEESTRCQKRTKSKKRVSIEEESSSNKVQRISPASKESIIGGLTLEEEQKALVEMRNKEDKKLGTSVLQYSLDGVAGTATLQCTNIVHKSQINGRAETS